MANLSVETAPLRPAPAGLLALPVVRPFEPGLAEDWDRFVLAQPSGSFFHLTAWMSVIAKTFGFKPRYVCAQRGGRITAVAPLFAVSNWVVGHGLISLPLAVYGGI